MMQRVFGSIFVAIILSSYAGDGETEFASDPGRPTGAVKGVRLVNQHLRAKVFAPDARGTSAFDISSIAGESIQTLRTVLGGYNEGSVINTFNGGTPNPYNILLWQVLIEAFSNGLTHVCVEGRKPGTEIFFEGGTMVTLQPQLEQQLLVLCALEGISLESKAAALRSIWFTMFGYGYEDEQSAWVDYFSTSELTGSKLIHDMVVAMMFNPYFLLAH